MSYRASWKLKKTTTTGLHERPSQSPQSRKCSEHSTMPPTGQRAVQRWDMAEPAFPGLMIHGPLWYTAPLLPHHGRRGRPRTIDMEGHKDVLVKGIVSPIGVVIVLLWAACFVTLLVCTCYDSCDAATLKARGPMRLPRIAEAISAPSDLGHGEILEEGELGYADMADYLQSRHSSTTSD